jgi:transposase-like protein
VKHIDRKNRPELEMTETIRALPAACSDELTAVEFIERQRWGNCPCCVDCGSVKVYKMRDRVTGERNKRFLWRCHDCKRQYTVRIGTVYEETRIELRHWCYAFWRASTSKKGVSALEIMRHTGLAYKSALFLMHRIKFAMVPDHGRAPKLMGTLEADEMYVGGKSRYPGHKKKGGSDKAPVFAVLCRNGEVRARAMATVNAKNVREALAECVDFDSRLMTDENAVYKIVGPAFKGGHDTVHHTSKEYARGDVTTNTVEGFFAIMRRGLDGIYHSVSVKHLPKYVGEYEFRWNARKMTDGARTTLAIRSADGKRLMYKHPMT